MELVETDGKLNLNAPTDGWLHLIERDGKSGDLLGLIMRPDWQTDKGGSRQKCVDAAAPALGRRAAERQLAASTKRALGRVIGPPFNQSHTGYRDPGAAL